LKSLKTKYKRGVSYKKLTHNLQACLNRKIYYTEKFSKEIKNNHPYLEIAKSFSYSPIIDNEGFVKIL